MLVMRGEAASPLSRRMVVAASRTSDDAQRGEPVFADPNMAGAGAPILFHAHLTPDIPLSGSISQPTQIAITRIVVVPHRRASDARRALASTLTAEGKPAATTGAAHDLHWNDLGPR